MKVSTLKLAAAAALVGALSMTAVTHAGVLETVQERGHLKCGISEGLPGFSAPDKDNNWTGIDVEYCQAVAAAVLGDASAIRFTSVSDENRFALLQSGNVDILAHNATWTLTRDADLGLDFVAPIFYAGQGFLVKKSLGVDNLSELSGATICITKGTTTELNVADYFRAHDMEYEALTVDTPAETIRAFDAGRCDAYTDDVSALAAGTTKLKDPDAVKVLPDLISKEPLAPVVQEGDARWKDIAQWIVYAWFNAEEAGVTTDNVDDMLESNDPQIQRLLGVSGQMGKKLGLPNDWAYQIVKQVGNYGEVYERTVGLDSPLKLERGENALWTDGGLMYGMPIR